MVIWFIRSCWIFVHMNWVSRELPLFFKDRDVIESKGIFSTVSLPFNSYMYWVSWDSIGFFGKRAKFETRILAGKLIYLGPASQSTSFYWSYFLIRFIDFYIGVKWTFFGGGAGGREWLQGCHCKQDFMGSKRGLKSLWVIDVTFRTGYVDGEQVAFLVGRHVDAKVARRCHCEDDRPDQRAWFNIITSISLRRSISILIAPCFLQWRSRHWNSD